MASCSVIYCNDCISTLTFYFLRMLNPASRLTRTPDFDGTTARLTGTLRLPTGKLTPTAAAKATPTGVKFGPTANSMPFAVRTPTSQLKLGIATPCSSPPNRNTHSVTALSPFAPL